MSRMHAPCREKRNSGKLKSHYSVIFILDYCSRGIGVGDLCIIAQGLLSEFVIQPSVYSTVKPSTVGWKIQLGGSEMQG